MATRVIQGCYAIRVIQGYYATHNYGPGYNATHTAQGITLLILHRV